MTTDLDDEVPSCNVHYSQMTKEEIPYGHAFTECNVEKKPTTSNLGNSPTKERAETARTVEAEEREWMSSEVPTN